MSYKPSYFCGWLLNQGAPLLIQGGRGTRDHKNKDETGKHCLIKNLFSSSRTNFYPPGLVHLMPFYRKMVEAHRAVFRSMTFWCGSGSGLPLTKGSGSGSCSFRHLPSRCRQKTNFLTFFFLFLFEGTFSKKKSQKEVTKQ
jgi:hypothetical protein